MKVPRDASIDVQASIREIHDSIRALERASAVPRTPSVSTEDVKKEIFKATRRPTTLDFRDVFRASGAAHAMGYVPDPGATAGTTRYLREDGQWLEGNIEQAGFENYGEDSTISFVDGTRTFTIAPTGISYLVWTAGQQYTKTAAENVVIADDEGLHTIYFDTAGVLTAVTGPPTIAILEGKAFVAAIYWDDTNNTAIIFADERHGREMDGQTHAYLHFTFGTRYESGLGLGNMTVDGNGDSDSHAQFSVADGAIWDEDLRFEIADDAPQDLSTIAEIPIYYLSGASAAWRKFAATSFPCRTADGSTGKRLGYNQLTGGAWQITEVANLNYVLMHYFATDNVAEPIIGVFGQAEYATLALARAGAETEMLALQFGQMDALINEFKSIATVIFQTSLVYANTVNARVRSTDTGANYVDWRFVSGGGASGLAVSSVRPSCHVYNTGEQTISNNTQTDVTFDSEDHDNAAMHSTGSNTDRITIPSDGIYCFGAHLIWDANATGNRQTHITLNDAAPVAAAAKLVRSDILPTAHSGNFAFHQLSSTRKLIAGDILRVSVVQTSGGNLNIFGTTSGGPAGSSFWCFKVSD